MQSSNSLKIILIANKAELKTVKNYEHQINNFGIEEFIKITALSKNSLPLIYSLIKHNLYLYLF